MSGCIKKVGFIFRWATIALSLMICITYFLSYSASQVIIGIVAITIISLTTFAINAENGNDIMNWSELPKMALLPFLSMILMSMYFHSLSVNSNDFIVLFGTLSRFSIIVGIVPLLLSLLMSNANKIVLKNESQSLDEYINKNKANRLAILLSASFIALFSAPMSGNISVTNKIAWLTVIFVALIQLGKARQVSNYYEIHKYEDKWKHLHIGICASMVFMFYVLQPHYFKGLCNNIVAFLKILRNSILDICVFIINYITSLLDEMYGFALYIYQNPEAMLLIGLIMCLIICYAIDRKNKGI